MDLHHSVTSPQRSPSPSSTSEAPPANALFWRAVEGGQLDAVRYALECRAEVDQTNVSGATALSVAAKHGHGDVVSLLLAAGARVCHTDAEGRTALDRAAQHGHAAVVWRLLRRMGTGAEHLLMIAAAAGDVEAVRRLLRTRAPVDETDEDGRTPLFIACRDGHLSVAELLEGAGAVVERAGPDGCTPLLMAAQNGHTELVQWLLTLEAAVDRADDENRTPLWAAVEKGHTAVAQLLVSAQASVDRADTDGRTPLYIAAENGHAAVAELLLLAQAAVDRADNDNRTPLWAASLNGHLAVATLLVGAGAAVDAAKSNGCTSLYVAAEFGHTAVAQLLVSAQAAVDRGNNKNCTPLWAASLNGQLAVATLLVEAGAAVDAAGTHGATPLSVAAQFGHTAVAQLLVSAQAAVDRADNENCTPLWAASIYGHLAVATLLVGAGAAVDAAGNSGATPLSVAAKRGHTAVAQLLVSAQAAVDRADKKKRTPLWAASDNGHLAVATLLVEAGAAVDVEDSDGETPLYIAAKFGHTAVAQLLVSAQAAVDRARSGRTPLYIAAENGHVAVVELLLLAQAAVDQDYYFGGTPLLRACLKGHLEVATLLWESKADPNHRPKHGMNGMTSLLAATRGGFHLVVRGLLAVGADHRLADADGDTPLWAAVVYPNPDCVEALLEAGADANYHHPQTGQSALMRAAATGVDRSINLLLSHGATPEGRDHAGFTIYYHADYTVAERFAPPRLEELLELCGAPTTTDTTALAELLHDPLVNINAGDKYLHWTPLMEAIFYGSAETVTYLLSNGADPKVSMFCGLTVAFWAELRGDDAVRRVLGAGMALTDAEAVGLDRVRKVRQLSPEAAELLAYNGVVAEVPTHPREAQRRPRRQPGANLSVQDRMADVATDTREGQFYPANYQCPVSLYRFLTTDPEKFTRNPKVEEGVVAVGPAALTPPTTTEEDVLTLVHMVAEGRKAVVVHVAAPNMSLQPQKRDCPPEDVFALFCYTFESIAYQHSNWAMRHWNQPEAQATVELWRPFIYHLERALRRLPVVWSDVLFRGIPIGFEAAHYGVRQTFVWPAFSSTSKLLKVAKNFALQQTKALIFVINGQSGVSIRHFSRYPAEAEVLFPPNLCLEVKWLGRRSVLDQPDTLRCLSEYWSSEVKPHALTTEEAEAEAVVVVYCEELRD